MRKIGDRLRHTVLFEIFGLAICVPAASAILHAELARTGVLALGLSLFAMAWNVLYNWLFDLVLLKAGRSIADRPVGVRIFHAVLFEVGMLVITLPAVAWWMGISMWQALLMDLGFAMFFTLYAFVYNWVYDRVFPCPSTEKEGAIVF